MNEDEDFRDEDEDDKPSPIGYEDQELAERLIKATAHIIATVDRLRSNTGADSNVCLSTAYHLWHDTTFYSQ